MNLKQRLNYNEHQHKLYIPNEIFIDMKQLHDKGSSHVAFAYTYYYFISWLYRYAKYGELNIDVKLIKEILGYSADNKKVNYLIKKDGLLDQIGYTYSDTDYPITWEWNKGDIQFTMLSELDDEFIKMIQQQKGKNYKVKVPAKGLWRDAESREDNYWNGTFYEIDYTHEMSFDVFAQCMENESLGVSGFYLYGYLKYRCDKFGQYCSSVERLGEEVGMSKNTCDKYICSLCLAGLVKYKENGCEKVNGEYKKKANSYSIS